MSSEQNKAIVRRYFEEVYNQGRTALILELFTEDFTDAEHPGHNGQWLAKHIVNYERSVLPDIQFTVEDLLAEGDDVIVRLTIRGTHRGAYRGVALTGRPVEITGVERLRDGKIAAVVWHIFDQFTLLSQMGALPAVG
jgi:predicted ester cyclase